MKETSLCYLYRDNEVLMLHRTKKENDLNEGKWIGIGGHFEENESPEDCVLREVEEETGLKLTEYRYRGIITFVSDRYEGEHMHLFTATAFTGTLTDHCPEGDPVWIPKDQLFSLPHWEGDTIFLDLLQKEIPFFSLKLEYKGEELYRATLNGSVIQKRI